MKIEQKPADFLPVKITLESQEEVDKLHGLFNCTVLTEALGIRDWFEKLSQYKSPHYENYFDIVDRLLK